jgi:hypothetical protein
MERKVAGSNLAVDFDFFLRNLDNIFHIQLKLFHIVDHAENLHFSFKECYNNIISTQTGIHV